MCERYTASLGFLIELAESKDLNAFLVKWGLEDIDPSKRFVLVVNDGVIVDIQELKVVAWNRMF